MICLLTYILCHFCLQSKGLSNWLFMKCLSNYVCNCFPIYILYRNQISISKHKHIRQTSLSSKNKIVMNSLFWYNCSAQDSNQQKGNYHRLKRKKKHVICIGTPWWISPVFRPVYFSHRTKNWKIPLLCSVAHAIGHPSIRHLVE